MLLDRASKHVKMKGNTSIRIPKQNNGVKMRRVSKIWVSSRYIGKID